MLILLTGAVEVLLSTVACPKQAVLKSPESEQLYILQEKLELNKMATFAMNNIDFIIDGDYEAAGNISKNVVQALQKEDNKKILAKFIESFPII